MVRDGTEQAAPRVRSRRYLLVLLPLASAAAAAVFVTQAPDELDVEGQVLLADAEALGQYVDGQACAGSGGYGDIRTGASVTVEDESRVVLGTTELESGQMVSGYCRFNFRAIGVRPARIYGLTVGSERRGTQRFTAEELERRDNRVLLTLGDNRPATPNPGCPTASQFDVEVKKDTLESLKVACCTSTGPPSGAEPP